MTDDGPEFPERLAVLATKLGMVIFFGGGFLIALTATAAAIDALLT